MSDILLIERDAVETFTNPAPPATLDACLTARIIRVVNGVPLKHEGQTSTLSAKRVRTNIPYNFEEQQARLVLPRLGIFDGTAKAGPQRRLDFFPLLQPGEQKRLNEQIHYLALKPGPDRRRHSRIAPIHRSGLSCIKGKAQPTKIIDLSQGGLFVEFEKEGLVSIGEMLTVGPWAGEVLRADGQTAAIRLNTIQDRSIFIGFPEKFRL